MGSEEKLARASELSRVGDAQWDCSGESSMPTGSDPGPEAPSVVGLVRKFCRKQLLTTTSKTASFLRKTKFNSG